MLRTRLFPTLILATICVLVADISPAQTIDDGSDSQAVALVRAAVTEMANGVLVNDLSLTGSAEFAPPNTNARVTIKIKGACQVSVSYSAGPRQNERYNDCQLPSGAWQDSHGAQHQLAFHNALIPAAVVNPLALFNFLLQPRSVLQYVGEESLDGSPVVHLRYFRAPQKQNPNPHLAALLQHLSTLDFYLTNSHTLAAAKFNIHPNENATRDIPVEVRFSDYRTVDGVLIPFHIQRVIDGSLNMDLTVSDVQINTGLSDAEFALD